MDHTNRKNLLATGLGCNLNPNDGATCSTELHAPYKGGPHYKAECLILYTSYSPNSLRGYIEDYRGEYYRGY